MNDLNEQQKQMRIKELQELLDKQEAVLDRESEKFAELQRELAILKYDLKPKQMYLLTVHWNTIFHVRAILDTVYYNWHYEECVVTFYSEENGEPWEKPVSRDDFTFELIDSIEEIREWVKIHGIDAKLSEWFEQNGQLGKLGSTWNIAGEIVSRGLIESFWKLVRSE